MWDLMNDVVLLVYFLFKECIFYIKLLDVVIVYCDKVKIMVFLWKFF